jgi:hypothetical protein
MPFAYPRQTKGRPLHIARLIFRAQGLASAQQSVASDGDDNAH